MKVYFSTDWTLNDSLLTEVDNVITLHPQEIGYNGENVCLIATNELNEVIATSGCGEEEPLITERFIRFWAESGFPAEMDIEISELYLEDNQLPSPPIILETFVDKYNNVYGSQQACEEGERKADYQHFLDWEDFYLADLEKQARKDMKKHVLVKKANLPKKVDWEMLVNSSSDIWNGGYELAETQNINETVKTGQEACVNLELFFQLMKNPKFATKASFEIEKILNHGKN
jgi:hypothetical protein